MSRLPTQVYSSHSGNIHRIALAIATAGLAWMMTTQACSSSERLTADDPGPALANPFDVPGIAAYNQALVQYRAKHYTVALKFMRQAIRSRQLAGRALGHGFANLCLMYLREQYYKQAFAACVKAKRILPGFGPVLINIQRVKARERLK